MCVTRLVFRCNSGFCVTDTLMSLRIGRLTSLPLQLAIRLFDVRSLDGGYHSTTPQWVDETTTLTLEDSGAKEATWSRTPCRGAIGQKTPLSVGSTS